MRHLRLARMMEEREATVVFGVIGMSKARIWRKSNIFHSVFNTELSVRSIASARASATRIRQDFGILVGMR